MRRAVDDEFSRNRRGLKDDSSSLNAVQETRTSLPALTNHVQAAAPARQMNNVSSVRSLGTTSSHAGSELSAFERSLPQTAEHIETTLPKGMRFALSSQLAGAGKMARVLEDTGTTYNVTVEPHGKRTFVKEMLRAEAMTADDSSGGLQLPEVRFNDERLDAIIDERHDRAVFRQERLRKFNTHRFMPALVTERLVPCWRVAGRMKDGLQAQFATPAVEASRKLKAACDTAPDLPTSKVDRKKDRKSSPDSKMTFVTPTMSVAMKRQTKVEVPLRGWHANGMLDVHEAMHPPLVMFESGGCAPMWEELEKEKTRKHNESKKLWLSHDVLPAGIAKPCSEEVLEIRQQSKRNLQSLHSQYAQRRSKHQRHGARRTSNLGESAFDKYFRECKVKSKIAAEEAARAAAIERNVTTNKFDLGGLLSIS